MRALPSNVCNSFLIGRSQQQRVSLSQHQEFGNWLVVVDGSVLYLVFTDVTHFCIAIEGCALSKPAAVHRRHRISIWIERRNLCETNLRNVDLRMPSAEIGGATNKFKIPSFYGVLLLLCAQSVHRIAPLNWIALHSHGNRSVWLFHIELCLSFARSLAGQRLCSTKWAFEFLKSEDRQQSKKKRECAENVQTMLSPSLFAWFLHTVENELSILVSFSFSCFFFACALAEPDPNDKLKWIVQNSQKRIKRITTKKCAQHFSTRECNEIEETKRNEKKNWSQTNKSEKREKKPNLCYEHNQQKYATELSFLDVKKKMV